MIAAFQRTALVLSYQFYRSRRTQCLEKPISWVVGPDEYASMVIQIAGVMPLSYSISFTEENVFQAGYDHTPRTSD
jgi:hypothetical protein